MQCKFYKGMAIALILAPLVLASSIAAWADKPATPSQAVKGQTALATAHSLIAYARENDMPEGLVTAALILSRVSKGEEIKAKVEGEEPPAPLADNESLVLLEEAKDLAETPAQKALIAEAEKNLKGGRRGEDEHKHKGHKQQQHHLQKGQQSKTSSSMKGKSASVSANQSVSKPAPGKKRGATTPPSFLLEVLVGDKVIAKSQGCAPVIDFAPDEGTKYTMRVTNLSLGDVDCQIHIIED